jgi:hypothetical protein
MRAEQDSCVICGSTKTLNVDHDHTCCPGQSLCNDCVRDVLCFRCNVAIGLLDDDPEKCKTAAAYLRKHHRRRQRRPRAVA